MAQRSAVITYVDGRGRAEMVRYLLSAGEVPFCEQFVHTKADLEAARASGKLLFNQLPLLELDGLAITQSHAMMLYIARTCSLYGDTDEHMVRCDQIYDAIRDSTDGGKGTIGFAFQPDEAAARARNEQLRAKYWPMFERLLSESASGWLVGGRLSWVDVHLMHDVEWALDYEPAAVLEPFPLLAAHYKRVRAVPGIARYIASPQKKHKPDAAYVKMVHSIFR